MFITIHFYFYVRFAFFSHLLHSNKKKKMCIDSFTWILISLLNNLFRPSLFVDLCCIHLQQLHPTPVDGVMRYRKDKEFCIVKTIHHSENSSCGVYLCRDIHTKQEFVLKKVFHLSSFFA